MRAVISGGGRADIFILLWLLLKRYVPEVTDPLYGQGLTLPKRNGQRMRI